MPVQSKCSASDARAITVTTGEHKLGRNGRPDALVTDDRRHPVKVTVSGYRCAGCDRKYGSLPAFNRHLAVR